MATANILSTLTLGVATAVTGLEFAVADVLRWATRDAVLVLASLARSSLSEIGGAATSVLHEAALTFWSASVDVGLGLSTLAWVEACVGATMDVGLGLKTLAWNDTTDDVFAVHGLIETLGMTSMASFWVAFLVLTIVWQMDWVGRAMGPFNRISVAGMSLSVVAANSRGCVAMVLAIIVLRSVLRVLTASDSILHFVGYLLPCGKRIVSFGTLDMSECWQEHV